MLVAESHLSQGGIRVDSPTHGAEETGRGFSLDSSSGVQLCVGSSSHCRGPHKTTVAPSAASAAWKAYKIRADASCSRLDGPFPLDTPTETTKRDTRDETKRDGLCCVCQIVNMTGTSL